VIETHGNNILALAEDAQINGIDAMIELFFHLSIDCDTDCCGSRGATEGDLFNNYLSNLLTPASGKRYHLSLSVLSHVCLSICMCACRCIHVSCFSNMVVQVYSCVSFSNMGCFLIYLAASGHQYQ